MVGIVVLGFLLSPLSKLKNNAHEQQGSLQAASNQVYTPGTPAFLAKSRRQTCSKYHTTRCLDAHHGNTQAAHPLEHVGRVDLRKVLDRSKDCCKYPKEVCPSLQVVWTRNHEVRGDDEYHDGVKDGDSGHCEGSAVGRSFSVLRRIYCGRSCSWKEDQKQEEYEGEA